MNLRFFNAWKSVLRRIIGGATLAVLVPILAAAKDTTNVVLAPHAKELVALQGDKLVSVGADNVLAAPYTILYFGAGGCPDCRKFSPKLVAAYNAQSKRAARFEVVLISRDRSADELQRFMATEKMPWPALAFD